MFSPWLRTRFQARSVNRRGARRRPGGTPRRSLSVEPLEDRALLSTLSYETILGGSRDEELGRTIAVDGNGSNIYVAGSTTSTNFPATNGTSYKGGTNGDAFVAKFNATTGSLTWATYLGGSGSDRALGIAVDGSGNVYVTGLTSSTDFPTTRNAFRRTHGGGGFYDAFVAEFNTNLPGDASLVYSTYLGGSGSDDTNGIAVDGSGNVYVTGRTDSTDFPTRNPLQPRNGGGQDAYVTQFNTNLSGDASLVYSTYLGGSVGVTGGDGDDYGYGIAVNSTGVYVAGVGRSTDFPSPLTSRAYDRLSPGGFVTRLDPTLTGIQQLIYSTKLGECAIYGLAVDGLGNAYVTGFTGSTSFPTRNAYDATLDGSTDAFVTKLNTNLSGNASLVYSTYLGGRRFDYGRGIAVDSSGNVYVTGKTDSTNFPTLNAYDPTLDVPLEDAFVAKLDPARLGIPNLLDSTYYGRRGADIGYGIAVDSSGNAYVAGNMGSDAFVAKLIKLGSPPSLAAVLVPVDGAGSAGAESIATTTGGGNAPMVPGALTSAQASVAPAAVVPASGPSTHGRTPGGTRRLGRLSPQYVDQALADFEMLLVDDLVLARLATGLPSAFPG